MPPHRELDREEIASLVKRGRDFITSGDPAGARVVLQGAAKSNDAEAALDASGDLRSCGPARAQGLWICG
jgi:hypothetical protein